MGAIIKKDLGDSMVHYEVNKPKFIKGKIEFYIEIKRTLTEEYPDLTDEDCDFLIRNIFNNLNNLETMMEYGSFFINNFNILAKRLIRD